MENGSAFPIRVREYSIELAGEPCNAVSSLYADRVMIVISQLATLGTLVHAEKESLLGGGTTFSIKTLLGSRDDVLPEICARRLIQAINEAGCTLPLLLCIGLKRSSSTINRYSIQNINSSINGNDMSAQRELVDTIVDAVISHKVW